MAFDDLHRHVARIALKAVGRKYEVALAGGNALMVHEVVSRHTEDVDLFVRRAEMVSAAASEIEAALQAAGYSIQRTDLAATGGLDELWPDLGEELAEWEVTSPDGEHTMQLQAAYFETLADPVTVPDLGPVLALDDLAGWKTVALVNRMMARDYVDIAALLKKYTAEQLIALALERDPGLQEADFADAGLHLDTMRDSRLAPLLSGLGGEDVAWLRLQFAPWPRDAVPREEPLQAAIEQTAGFVFLLRPASPRRPHDADDNAGIAAPISTEQGVAHGAPWKTSPMPAPVRPLTLPPCAGGPS